MSLSIQNELINLKDQIPDFLIQKLEKQYGKEVAIDILDGYTKNRVTSFRVNNIKSNNKQIEDFLESRKIDYRKVKWSEDVFVLENISKGEIEELDIYKNGLIYLQSLSAMLPVLLLSPRENEDILDMAAAPGGKTTQIASVTNNKANITAMEINNIRAEKLKYNVEKQGARVSIMIKDARNIDDLFSYDKVLLDSPCSGSGTISIYDKELNKHFTEKLIEKSCKTQLSLLGKALNILKPGKEMIYSTCSILVEENENIVNKAIDEFNKDKKRNKNKYKAQVVQIDTKLIEDVPLLKTIIPGTICIKPTKCYEGFFIAKIKKCN